MPKKLKAKQIAAKLLGRHGDGGGLWLHVRKSGSRSWELRWMLRGKAESMGLGSYPDVSLAQAREAADECRRMVMEGRDPRKARAQKTIEEKLRPSFREFSTDWVNRRKGSCSDSYIRGCECKLRLYVWPVKLPDGRQLGELGTNEFDTEAVLAVLSPIWKTKITTAVETRKLIEQILDAASALDLRAGDNPARWRGHLSTYFPKPRSVRRPRHRPSLPYNHAPNYVAQLWPGRATDDALVMLIHTAVRVSVVCLAEWDDIGWKGHKWLVPEDRSGMKGLDVPNGVFVVPLSAPLMAMLRRRFGMRVNKYIFPGQRPGGHISKTTLLRRAKQLTSFVITNHGFRATSRTWAAKRTICEKEPKEMALGDTIGDATENAYARDDWLEKRRLRLEVWSEFLVTGVDRVVDVNAMFLQRFGEQASVPHAAK